MINVRNDGWVGVGTCGIYMRRAIAGDGVAVEVHRGSGYGVRDRVGSMTVDELVELAKEIAPEKFVVVLEEDDRPVEEPSSPEEFNDVLEEDRL